MKKCDICESTEDNDTLWELGIESPIQYWVKLEVNPEDPSPPHADHRCSRCYEAVNETLVEMGDDDLFTDQKLEEYLEEEDTEEDEYETKRTLH